MAVQVIQEKNFKIDAEPEGEKLVLTLVGQVNEDVDFNKVYSALAPVIGNTKTVHFKVRGISQINSCGVRAWLLFLEKVQAKYACVFDEIGEIFTEQASIVPNMLGKSGTPVMTFETPFFCPKCEKRFLKILKAQEIVLSGDSFTYPSFVCDTCKAPLEFDALEEEYFNFLKRSKT